MFHECQERGRLKKPVQNFRQETHQMEANYGSAENLWYDMPLVWCTVIRDSTSNWLANFHPSVLQVTVSWNWLESCNLPCRIYMMNLHRNVLALPAPSSVQKWYSCTDYWRTLALKDALLKKERRHWPFGYPFVITTVYSNICIVVLKPHFMWLRAREQGTCCSASPKSNVYHQLQENHPNHSVFQALEAPTISQIC